VGCVFSFEEKFVAKVVQVVQNLPQVNKKTTQFFLSPYYYIKVYLKKILSLAFCLNTL
jgi:hypothetical protein